jgi:hypothetical protein
MGADTFGGAGGVLGGAGDQHKAGIRQGRTSSFLKKRSKKLLLWRLHHLTRWCSALRGAERVNVFWFLFSKKNAFLALVGGLKPTLQE